MVQVKIKQEMLEDDFLQGPNNRAPMQVLKSIFLKGFTLLQVEEESDPLENQGGKFASMETLEVVM